MNTRVHERRVEQRAAISPKVTIRDISELPRNLVTAPPKPPSEASQPQASPRPE